MSRNDANPYAHGHNAPCWLSQRMTARKRQSRRYVNHFFSWDDMAASMALRRVFPLPTIGARHKRTHSLYRYSIPPSLGAVSNHSIRSLSLRFRGGVIAWDWKPFSISDLCHRRCSMSCRHRLKRKTNPYDSARLLFRMAPCTQILPSIRPDHSLSA
jgi:hypothetical protein